MTTPETESRMPRILEGAPDFEAKTTQDVFRPSDITDRGKRAAR